MLPLVLEPSVVLWLVRVLSVLVAVLAAVVLCSHVGTIVIEESY